jgi:nitrite reductase/ring-hydroxylating ferredoxin subunit
MPFFELCSESDVPAGRGKRVMADGEEIVLFRVDGRIVAVANMCPHQKFKKLHDGLYENGIVTCPMHGWAYDVRTGNSTNASGKLKTYDITVKNSRIFLELDPMVK